MCLFRKTDEAIKCTFITISLTGKANLKIRKCFLQFHGNNLSFLLWKDGKMMHFGDISYFDFTSA